MKKGQTHSKGGRPTSYRPEYAQQLVDFFESYIEEPFIKVLVSRRTITKKDGTVDVTEEFKNVSKGLPLLIGFAMKIGVDYTTVFRWSTDKVGPKPGPGEDDNRPFKYPEFCNAYKKHVMYQTQFLTQAGMSGAAPAAFAIFTAKNVIGWRDTHDERFVDGQGRDRQMPGFVVLPRRLTDEEVASEYNAQQGAGAPLTTQ